MTAPLHKDRCWQLSPFPVQTRLCHSEMICNFNERNIFVFQIDNYFVVFNSLSWTLKVRCARARWHVHVNYCLYCKVASTVSRQKLINDINRKKATIGIFQPSFRCKVIVRGAINAAASASGVDVIDLNAPIVQTETAQNSAINTG